MADGLVAQSARIIAATRWTSSASAPLE